MKYWLRFATTEQIRRERERRRGIKRPQLINLTLKQWLAGWMICRYSTWLLNSELDRRGARHEPPWVHRRLHYPPGTLYK